MEFGLGLWHSLWQSDLRIAGRNCNTPVEFYPNKYPKTKLSKAAHVGFHGAEWRQQQEPEQVQEPEEEKVWPQRRSGQSARGHSPNT